VEVKTVYPLDIAQARQRDLRREATRATAGAVAGRAHPGRWRRLVARRRVTG
jgi:hypothetical protein